MNDELLSARVGASSSHPVVRRCAIAFGALSALLLLVAVPLALISPMALDGGGDTLDHLLTLMLFFGPLYLLLSAAAGYLAYRRSTVQRAALAVAPPVIWLAVLKLIQL